MEAAVRRDRYVIVPGWYKLFLLYRIFAPEVMDWTNRYIIQVSALAGKSARLGRPAPYRRGPIFCSTGSQQRTFCQNSFASFKTMFNRENEVGYEGDMTLLQIPPIPLRFRTSSSKASQPFGVYE